MPSQDTLDSYGLYKPADLLNNANAAVLAANSVADKDKVQVTADKLKIGTPYLFQFQYVFPDGTLSEWSPTFFVPTAAIATLAKPKLTSANISYFQGILKVTWDGTDFNGTAYGNAFSKILVWIRDNSDPSPLFKILGELTRPGTFQIAVPPKSQTVKIQALSIDGAFSVYSDDFTITPVVTAPSAPTGLTPAWSGTDFTLSFTSDPSASANEYLKEYLVSLTASDNQTKVFSLVPKSGSSQKFSLSLQENQAAFGAASQSFSGSIQTLDIYGNKGTAVTFNNTAYVSALTVPTLTVSAITNGYSVTYPTQTSNTFQFISIEEVQSSASTDPGTGYSGVARGSSNPLVVPTINTNKRWVRARLFDTLNSSTAYSTAVAVTPLSPVTVDNDGPPDVTTVTTTGGLDSSGTVGFNGYADISWNSVTTGGIRGYRIRFRPVTTPASSYSYADSPGSGTSYRLAGLGAGLTYEIAVATYDEYNNTSSNYISGSNVSVGGTPYIASTVDVTGYFKAKANPSDADSTAFKFGYGVDTGKRGLVFNANNYWYIDSSQTATLKVGGSTTNYIEWNGSSFVIDGDMRAKKGSFSGNVNIASGASIYSGTLTGNTVTATGDTGGNLAGAGYILNSSGLTFSSATVSGVTTIDATTGNFITKSANIGGWLINSTTNPNQIYKVSGTNAIKLDSSIGSIQADGTGYTAGFGLPDNDNIVFWAGSSRSAAPFRVYKDGSVIATSLTISGYATSQQLTDGLATKITTGGAASDVNLGTTNISGNKIRTGLLQSNNWSGTVTDGSNYSSTGMTIDLSTGAMTSPKFRIDTDGNASFNGTISASNVNGGTLSGAQINIGNNAFMVSSTGVLTATSGTFSGNVSGGTFSLNSNTGTNYWTTSEFRAGGSSAYISVSPSSGTTTLFSSQSQTLDVDEGGGLSSYQIDQKIVVNSSSITIQGLPGVGNGLTAYGNLLGPYGDGIASTLITQYWAAGYTYAGREPSYNYGAAARYRMVVADPYDYNKLKRGFGVYYGVRGTNSVPSASTGFVGDIWISW
jgi:hypothetical protein